MSAETIFRIHLALGYVTWLLCFGAYVWPWLKSMERDEAQRAIATVHSFRFFGLVFLVPGVTGDHLPADFSAFSNFSAYGDFATGLLAILALLAFRVRPLFLALVVAFNLVGVVDLLGDYTLATLGNLPARAGEFGSTYAIPIIYVPLLMITHVVAFYLLMRSRAAVAAASPAPTT
ncbi:MAG TPA: hypothetical protein VFL62_08890 [Bradyrhizobium sp.]|uniref:hypothetical protein n=1 Tax=Bradyrhizobium sp. TaxID=376 RepID=UPI002D80FB6C|nr:hypothetical protein [Bradyrhizobium sp.]HET7886326.1 hypothetical protein [Bradyrhizobium sp.]